MEFEARLENPHPWLDTDTQPDIILPEGMNHNKYPADFKIEVLKHYRDITHDARETAAKFDLTPVTVSTWVRAANLPEYKPTDAPTHVYSDREKAQVMLMLDLGESIEDIKKRTGVPMHLIRKWKSGVDVSSDVQVMRVGGKVNIAELCESKLVDVLKAIDKKTLDKATLTGLVKGAQGLLEMRQLVSNKPTSITEDRNLHANISDVDAVALMLDEINNRRAEPVQLGDGTLIECFTDQDE